MMSYASKCSLIGAALLTATAYADIPVSTPASATIYLDGQAGDWVSGALPTPQVTWTQGVSGTVSAYISNWARAPVVSLFTPITSWQFAFAAPTNDPLNGIFGGAPPTVGFYGNATRWPFEKYNEPGISATGGGRGVNTASGWFEVFEITLNADQSEYLSLAVDFQQWDTTLGIQDPSGPSLYGSIRVNSTIPIHMRPVPEASTGWMLLAGMLTLLVWTKHVGQTTRRSSMRACTHRAQFAPADH